MKTTLAAAAFASALACAAPAGAAVLGFGSATPIDIDPVTNEATYLEAGYAVRGPAASFLPLDDGAGGAWGLGGYHLMHYRAGGQVDEWSYGARGVDGFLNALWGSAQAGLFVAGDGGVVLSVRSAGLL